MNLLARARTFFQSARGKRFLSSAFMLSLVLSVIIVPTQLAFAQQGPPAPGSNNGAGSATTPVRPNAPGPTQPTATNGTQPSGAPAARTTTPASGTGTSQQGSSVIGAGVTSVDWSCGAFPARPDCLVQVAGAITTFIFSTIVYFLSKLLVLLTSVLIVFARYNKFNMAVPVDVGWAIARDIMNIFFIVALLASAFVTIIGKGNDYGLHYTKVVPQLFVGAILVNFSRTLMLLMIDASQVVTLTFISAFEGTIAGNTMQAFGITKIQSFQRSLGNTGNSPVNIIEIIVAYMLGIGLLTTAVTIIVIYVAYFIGRIVGLWLLIIVSPFYFAAETLPKKFGSIVSGATKEINGKITSLLIGGPQVAFFLWLAFATVQRVASSPNPTNAIGFDFDPNGTTGFLTQIGTAPEFGAFIIATALLAAGLKTVSSAASDVGMGSVVKTVSGYGEKAKSMLQRSPWTMTKAGAGYANQRFGITNGLAQGIARGAAGQRTQGALQGIGGAFGSSLSRLPGVGGMLAAGAAAGVGAVGVKKLAEDRKAIDARIKNLDSLAPQDRIAAIRAMDAAGKDGSYSSLTTRAVAEAQHEALLQNRDVDLKSRQKEAAERIQQQMLAGEQEAARRAGREIPSELKLSDAQKSEVDRQAKAIATRELANDEAARVKRLREFATKANDTEALEKIKKDDKKYMRFADDKDYKKQVNDLVQTPEDLKNLDASVLNSGRFALEMLSQANIVRAGKDGKLELDKTLLKSFTESDAIKGNKELVSTLKAAASLIDGGASKDQIMSSTKQKDAFGVARLYAVSPDGSGGLSSQVLYSEVEKGVIKQLRDSGMQDRAAGSALTREQQAAIANAVQAGLPLAHIQGLVDKTQDGKSDQAFFKHAANIARDIMSDPSITGEAALKQIEKLVSASKELRADSSVTQGIIEQALANQASVDKLFSGFYAPGSDKKAAGMLLAHAAEVAKNSARINDLMDYAQERYFPRNKTEIVVSQVTREIEVEEEVEKPRMIDGMEMMDSRGRVITEKAKVKVKKPVVENITRTIQAPSFITNIFEGRKLDYDA